MAKTKVAIIGGGVGAITAAYAIASDDALRDKYDLTVYQLGWRLGGKGASGRQADQGDRILEHGLHVWAGFYENAFRLLTDCYNRLNQMGLRDRDAPLGTIGAAFKPLSHVLLAEHVELDGKPAEWRPWLVDLPSNDLVPGTATSAPGPFEMFLRMLSILKTFYEDGEFGRLAQAHIGGDFDKLHGAHGRLHDHAHGMPLLPSNHSAHASSLLVDLIEEAQKIVADLQTPQHLANDAARRTLYLADLSLAYARGMAATEVFARGYDVLDQWEFTEFLRRHGAGERALNSVLLRGCYDFIFGYSAGLGLHGDCGAGTAIRAMSRLILSYRGAIFHEMQAGMGDTIFAPYYQALKALGVKFQFFNAARNLRLDSAGTRVEAIDMVEQAELGGDGYDPLVEVRGLPCWPSEPRWEQLKNGAKLRRDGIDFESEKEPPTGREYTLTAGEDFDQVILGASLGSLPYMTGELAKASQRWSRMLSNVRTVGTCAAQFWLREAEDPLGWRKLVEKCNVDVTEPDGPLRTIITGFGEPLDTWADMSHLLAREDWGDKGPKAIAYFCSPAPDGLDLDTFKARVRKWANDDLTQLWTGAEETGHRGFNDELLFKKPRAKGSSFDNQYFRVNLYGSERYVLSVTNSLYHRLAPAESGFDRLTLAGDWTRCGLNAGCVEAATMSGIAAAQAVTGKPMTNIGADDIDIDDSLQEQAMYDAANVSNASWPLSGFYARGQMNGWFFFYQMPRAEVQALLPAGVHLAQTDLAAPGMHPVGISLCRYHAVRGSFVPDFMAMSPYGEASFAIPFVRHDETGRAKLLYPRRLYVDSRPAIAAGKIFYAMDKVFAGTQVDDRSFRATDGAGRTFIDAHFTQHEDPQPLAHHPAFGTVSDLLDLPFVTTGKRGSLFNVFDMQLDHAWGAPASGHVTVTDTQPGGFPMADLDLTPLRPHHPHGLPGALRIWCNWSMTNPLDSARVRKAAMAQSWLRRTY